MEWTPDWILIFSMLSLLPGSVVLCGILTYIFPNLARTLAARILFYEYRQGMLDENGWGGLCHLHLQYVVRNNPKREGETVTQYGERIYPLIQTAAVHLTGQQQAQARSSFQLFLTQLQKALAISSFRFFLRFALHALGIVFLLKAWGIAGLGFFYFSKANFV